MLKQLFINLPVNDLEKSMQFYVALGFTTYPLFTDEEQKCLIWSESIKLMLQSRQFSNSYYERQIIDTRKHLMPSFTLPVDSIEQVNEMMDNGLKFGGREPVASRNESFMYLRSIEDVDGYIWGIMYLDIVKFTSIKNPIL